MLCPRCGKTSRKLRLDVYECIDEECRAVFLIHRFRGEEKRRDE